MRLSLAQRGAKLEVEGHRMPDVVIWADTAPRNVQVKVARLKGTSDVVLWNVWRDAKYGTMLYGINNSAIEVDAQDDGTTILRCSDGWLGPDFDDLVLAIKVIRGEVREMNTGK
jgi:hypothetical protein